MEDKKSSSILEKPLNKGISKETWKMEEKFVRFHESTIGRVKCELAWAYQKGEYPHDYVERIE